MTTLIETTTKFKITSLDRFITLKLYLGGIVTCYTRVISSDRPWQHPNSCHCPLL